MEQRSFGSTGERVAVIGQGTWNLERAGRAGAVDALRRGLDAGMTHVDTAELYGDGAVEELVGEAIAGRRDEVFLASKVVPEHATRAGVIAACERSLRRLRTDRLELYLLHWPGSVPLEETIAGFEDLVREGKVRHWGLSNFDTDELQSAVRLAGPGRAACNQVLYHLEERYIERDLVGVCRELGAALVAYSPFGSGAFPSAASPGGRVLADIARSRGATARQVALAFLTRDPAVFAIPKAASAAHALENAAAGDLRLSAGEICRIDATFAEAGGTRGLPML